MLSAIGTNQSDCESEETGPKRAEVFGQIIANHLRSMGDIRGGTRLEWECDAPHISPFSNISLIFRERNYCRFPIINDAQNQGCGKREEGCAGSVVKEIHEIDYQGSVKNAKLYLIFVGTL